MFFYQIVKLANLEQTVDKLATASLQTHVLVTPVNAAVEHVLTDGLESIANVSTFSDSHLVYNFETCIPFD